MDVRLPRLGEGADSGIVASLFIKEGGVVKKDQPVFELESEKAVASIPSPAAGTITKIYVKEGDEVKVGQLIFSLDVVGALIAVAEKTSPVNAAETLIQDTVEQESDMPEPPTGLETVAPARTPGIALPASPSVRKMARDLGIDLARVRGSERGGRIILEDVKRYIRRLQQPAGQSVPTAQKLGRKQPIQAVDFEKWGPVVRKRMTNLRKTISSKMVESWTTIPHITQFDDADITGILALRKKYAPKYEKKGGHLTLTPFALKALVSTLKKHPIFNTSIDEADDELVFKHYYHIGIAVDTEQGLIVPVIRDVERKNLLELSVELNELAEKTRQRKVSLEEMQGGTFTISNQGGIGSNHFTPIINKPEVAILGMGRGAQKSVIIKNKISIRTLLPICLSYDHRVIDGADAARFMVDLVQAFENFKEADVKL